MANKEIKFFRQAWDKLEKGVAAVADAVRVTLGPRGRNVILERRWGSPIITNDGVTIAREINLKDKFENMGTQLLKEVASKTNDIAGDGTTTAAILGHIIFKEGLKNIVSGANPMSVKRGIQLAAEEAIKQLKKQAKPVKDRNAITQVASIAANNDLSIGKLIADAMDKVGTDGVITIEESNETDTKLDIVKGMQFDRGWIAPHLVTDKRKMECVLEDAHILITDRKIVYIKDLLPCLNILVEKPRKPFFIIAGALEGEALAMLIANKAAGKVSVGAVRAPGFGENRYDILEDIAILTGSEVISETKGLTLETPEKCWFGNAKKVIISKNSTTIIDSGVNTKAVTERIAQLQEEIKTCKNVYDSKRLKERIGRLTGGIAIIKVGAATETELAEKIYRIEDSLNATRAAVEEGVVAGGGAALVHTIKALEKLEKQTPEEERVGVSIVKRALVAPLKQIADNAGLEGSVVVSEVRKEDSPGFGFNAQSLTYGNMFEAGVIDPVKVTRSALQNAASIAAMLLTTEALICEELEEDEVKNG